MSEDRGRLAPVSYLPGARPPADSATSSASPHVAAWAPPLVGPAVDSRAVDAHSADTQSVDAVPGVDDVLDEAHRESAYVAGVRALGRRPRSRRELERALRGREFDEAAVTAAADRLEREGALDDTALAQHLVGRLQERKGLGRTAIAAELARRMVAPAAIEYALELVDTGDELARARALAEKRAAQLRGLDHDTAVRRLSGYLQRRGYSGSTVRAAVEQSLPRSGVRFS